jgi:preprotein translocase subunit SecG
VDYLVYTLHILVCVFLILVVLLQHGKGADFSVFGGGSTQTAFGSRGTTTFLHKLTVFSFVVFVFTTLTISILKSGGGSSVVHGAGRGNTAGRAGAPVPGRRAPGASPRPTGASPRPTGASPRPIGASPAQPATATPATQGTPAKPAGDTGAVPPKQSPPPASTPGAPH